MPVDFLFNINITMEKEAKTSISEENKEERDDNLQRYELVYLISNKFSEDELEPITSAVIKLITDKSGKIY